MPHAVSSAPIRLQPTTVLVCIIEVTSLNLTCYTVMLLVENNKSRVEECIPFAMPIKKEGSDHL